MQYQYVEVESLCCLELELIHCHKATVKLTFLRLLYRMSIKHSKKKKKSSSLQLYEIHKKLASKSVQEKIQLS